MLFHDCSYFRTVQWTEVDQLRILWCFFRFFVNKKRTIRVTDLTLKVRYFSKQFSFQRQWYYNVWSRCHLKVIKAHFKVIWGQFYNFSSFWELLKGANMLPTEKYQRVQPYVVGEKKILGGEEKLCGVGWTNSINNKKITKMAFYVFWPTLYILWICC